MTTEAAAALYEAQHIFTHEGRNVAIFNPHDKQTQDLAVIYGFNNGGSTDWLSAVLIAEDGTELGSHCCSSEAYMPADLGILKGTRLDRHEGFQKHYPNGYLMEFVGFKDIAAHLGLNAAFAAHALKTAAASL